MFSGNGSAVSWASCTASSTFSCSSSVCSSTFSSVISSTTGCSSVTSSATGSSTTSSTLATGSSTTGSSTTSFCWDKSILIASSASLLANCLGLVGLIFISPPSLRGASILASVIASLLLIAASCFTTGSWTGSFFSAMI